MKIKITESQHPFFLKALQHAESVSQTTKTVIQSLGCVLLTAKDGMLSIQVNNLEQCIVIKINADIAKEGQIGVSAKDLSRIAKLGKSIELDATGTQAVIKCGGTFKLPMIAVEEFPASPDAGEDPKEVQFTGSELESILGCSYAVSVNDRRFVLQGVCVNPESKQGMASDGRRAAVSSYPPSAEGWGPIIPTIACSIMTNLIKGQDSVTMTFSETKATIKSERLNFYTKLIEGNYPNLRNALPNSSEFSVKINRKYFIEGIDGALIAQSDHNQIKLTLSKSSVALEVSGKNANADITVDLAEKASKKAEGFVIAVDSRLLRETLGAMKKDIVTLEFTDALTPMAIHSESYAVIMPMRTTK